MGHLFERRWDKVPDLYIWSFLVVVFIYLLSGCVSTEVTGERGASIAGNKDIVIGVAWPFEEHGDQFDEGLDLAVQEINNSGGVKGQSIRLVKKDDHAEVTEGMAVAQSFANDPEVVAVIGHRNSYVSMSVSDIYEDAGLLMLTPASTAPQLIHEESQYLFRGLPSDDIIAENLVKYAVGQGYERLVIHYEDHDYGRGLANAFEKHAGLHGIQIVDRFTFFGDELRRTQLINKWTNLQYDAVMVANNTEPGSHFIRQFRETEGDVPVLAGNALDTEQAQQLVEAGEKEVIIGSTFNSNDSRDLVVQFREKFRETYDIEPNQYAAQAYTAVYLLKEAMETSDSLYTQDIAEALRHTDDVEMVTGWHTFDEYGENVGDSVALRIIHQEGDDFIDPSSMEEDIKESRDYE